MHYDIDWRSRIFDMTSYFQDGGHDVIFTQKSAATWVSEHEAFAGRLCSSVRQFLIYGTLINDQFTTSLPHNCSN